MKLTLSESGYTLQVEREPADRTRYNTESIFLYDVLKELQSKGIQVCKRLMWKDGHLTSNQRHYLKTPRAAKKSAVPTFYITDDNYMIRDIGEAFTKHDKVLLYMTWDINNPVESRDAAKPHIDAFRALLEGEK